MGESHAGGTTQDGQGVVDQADMALDSLEHGDVYVGLGLDLGFGTLGSCSSHHLFCFFSCIFFPVPG